MALSRVVSTAHRLGARHRTALYAATLAILAGSFVASRGLSVREDIEAMLPDGGGSAAVEDFRLLQRAPLARKVVIDLRAGPGTSETELIAAADRLAGELGPPWFERVVTGPEAGAGPAMLPWLVRAVPGLCTSADLTRLEAGLTAESIGARLGEVRDGLMSPEGWVLKAVWRRDPLGFRNIGLEKLRYLNLIPGMRVVDNHFLSEDGRHALVIADTPVKITDAAGARDLLRWLGERLHGALPEGIEASVVSGHRYTAANAAAIRRDLVVVLSCSLLAMLAVFAVFLRSWRAVFVFLVPVSVVCLAAVVVSIGYHTVSAITLGFGAVLLGISVDFGLHAYFALRRGGAAPDAIVGAVARPVVYGALTTLGAFAVLLFSDLPGQRQLAVFSIAGIGASLVLSLGVLPHLLAWGGDAGAGPGPGSSRARPRGQARRWVLGGWLVVLAGCAWLTTGLRFNGDLRTLGLVPPGVRAAEGRVRDTWGDVRGHAMVFASGPGLEAALEANDRLFAVLQRELPGRPVVSLAPLLPSRATQEENGARWTALWSGARGEAAVETLDREARALGFSRDAFAPFRDALARAPAPIGPEDLRAAGLGPVLDALVVPVDAGVGVITLVPDTDEVAAALAGARKELPGVRLVSQGQFRREVSAAIEHDFLRFIVGASLVNLVLLILLYRDPQKILLSLLPVATGLLFTFGAMAALGLEFNLFNVVATILIIGLGVDYGIFMVCRVAEGYDHATERAVLVSGLTTIAGFGALVLARHPALHSIGVTVLLGIGAAIPAALWVVPACHRGTVE